MAKVALVTGGNRGIGFAIAGELARVGLCVLAGVRSEERAREAAAAFKLAGLSVKPVVLDVADGASISND